jgi:hypothetical protein
MLATPARAQYRISKSGNVLLVTRIQPQPDSLLGYVFPEEAAQQYRHLVRVLVPMQDSVIRVLTASDSTKGVQLIDKEREIVHWNGLYTATRTEADAATKQRDIYKKAFEAEHRKMKLWRTGVLVGGPIAMLALILN